MLESPSLLTTIFAFLSALIEEFGVRIPALDRLATIVRGADTARPDLAPECAGLLAASLGLSRMHSDDHVQLEAGMALEGWEVKAIRAGRAQLKEAYVIVRNGEVFLFGSHISPLATASTHVNPDPVRTRKLLLKAEEIKRLIGKVERSGYTLVPLNMHYQRGRIKCEIGLAKGKKQHDKRDTERSKDAQREIARVMGHSGAESWARTWPTTTLS